jgi:proline iminopeptidase
MIPIRALTMLSLVACAATGAGNSAPSSEGFVTTSDSTRLYYRILGSGPDTIVALHGGPGATISQFDPGLAPLGRHHAVLLYDQRGNGRSSPVPDSTHLLVANHVADLEAIRQHFGIRRLTLLGHSWGGGLAALYAAAHPQAVARLILVDAVPPRLHPFGEIGNKARLAGFDSLTRSRVATLMQAALGDTAHDKPALCRSFMNLFLRNYFVDSAARGRTVAIECADTADNIARSARVGRNTSRDWGEWAWDTAMTRVDAPVLVVQGRNDFEPLAGAEAWVSAFPHGRLVVIDHSGHFPFVEQPDAFFSAVEQFLRESAGQAAR